jgi:hypothetical protein
VHGGSLFLINLGVKATVEALRGELRVSVKCYSAVLLTLIRLSTKAIPGTLGWTGVLYEAHCTIIAYSLTYSCTLEAVFGLPERDWMGRGLLLKQACVCTCLWKHQKTWQLRLARLGWSLWMTDRWLGLF